jgi:filamentous hemagglutinin family protein
MACFANPTGGVVVSGDAIIQNTLPGITTITQSTDRAVIDWQSFSIGVGERTNFIVPDATSATLNRVLGGDPSILNGTLTSNGHLFLINSNGIVFGKGATVDVAGLTASTLNIDNCMFTSGGDMVFAGNSQAGIKNAGTIKASSGDVFLIGYQASNSGTIRAPNGTVGLAAGSEVLIRAAGDERVVVRTATGSNKKYGVSNSGVIEANVAELKAHGGNVYAMAIRNTGRVAATGVTVQGGRILLRADGGRIENSGTLVARGRSGNGGRIMVDAGRKGSVDINGRVDADGPNGAGGKISITGEKIEVRRAIAVTADGKEAGGQIEIGSAAPVGTNEAAASQTLIAGLITASSSRGTGGEIRLGGNLLTLQCGAEINANSATGGGQIFAGGGWSVTDSSLLDATCVTVENGALLTASALCNGDGGKIVVSAKYGLVFQGLLQAFGGADAGNGGVAELRAGAELGINQISGRVDLSAANGGAGSLLLYSGEWEISNRCLGVVETNSLNAEDIGNFLNSANLTIQSALGNAGGGNVVLSGTVTWCSANSLTINAACDFLLIEKAGDVGVIDDQGAGGVTINAGRFVSLETGTRIGTEGGDVRINANQQVNSNVAQAGITLGGDITTNGGNVSLSGVGVTSSGGAVDAGGGMILIDGNDGTINLTGALVTTNTSATAVRIIDASSVTLGNVTAAGTVVLGGAGGENLSGTVTQTGMINAETLTGNTSSAVFLNGDNTVVNLGSFTTTGVFIFNDASNGLNVTGNVETRGGAAAISTAGGVLALRGSNIKTDGGDVSLAGTGVTSTGGMVNAGSGTILVDGNDGAINLAGTLTTTNETATAVRIIDATTAQLGYITTGAAGTVVLGGAGGDNLSGAVTQTGAINAGTVAGNGGSTVTLDGRNLVVNLGAWQSADAFVFKDTSGGLNVTGNVETNAGAVSISTLGGALALGGSNITTNGGDVSLAGTGVTSTSGVVNAGSGAILVDGNDGAVNLAGSLTTTNETSTAVRVIDATTAKLGNITTGAAGAVVLGEGGGDNLSGAVTQTGAINAGTLTGNAGSTVMLDGSNTVVNLGEWKSADAFVFKDTSGGLNVTGNVEARGASISTSGGALAMGSSNITTNGGDVSLTGAGVTSTGGTVDAGGGTILVDGNDGAVNLSGALTTTNETGAAVRIIDASTASLGNITTGAAGAVVLGEGGGDNLSGAVTQSGAINAGTLTGNAGSNVMLDGSNTVVNLGPFTTTGAFTFNDASGGLKVTGNVETRGGAAAISTAGGALAMGGGNIRTNGGNVSLAGKGVTSTGGAVDAGGGTILVDGNDGAVSLAGALTTTNETGAAVRVIDATTAKLGNITTGAAGAVVLGEGGGDNLSGAVTQTGVINAGTLTGNTGSTVMLDGSNTVVNLGEWKSADAFVFKDTSGGLNVVGNVETRGASISTTGGALALGGSNTTTNGGDVSLTGTGVTSTGGKVDAGGGTILVDGNDGAVNLAGALTTTNETGAAVRIIDASKASLGNITTGAAGAVVLGEGGGDNLSGAVTQTGAIRTMSLKLEGDGDFNLTSASNAIGTVATSGSIGSLALVSGTGLTIGSPGQAGGVNARRDIRISSAAAEGLSVLGNVTSQGGTIVLAGATITVDGATVSSIGSTAVTLTGNQLILKNQPVINGVFMGGGSNTQITLNDSNLTRGETYIIDATRITAGTRIYDFQDVSVVNLGLGAGDDNSNTNFFTFSQFLNAGGGDNKLFVNGVQPTSSPLTKPGFGSIFFNGFVAPPPPAPAQTNVRLDGTPFGSLVLQNALPGTPGGSTGSQTNNFNSTSIGGAAGLAGALGAVGSTATVSGGLLANVTNTMGQSLGFTTAGGGAPPSLNAQSQLNAATSASVESELNAALGGDGRMGVRSSTGLVSVDPQGAPPTAGTVARLDSGMGLEALSELSFGVFGVSQVTLNNQFGAQALNLGSAPPSAAVQKKMAQIANPESFSMLSATLGGDGIARVESASGVISVDLKENAVPAALQARLMGIISLGSLGELMLALGGTGEFIVTESHGLVSMHASGTAPGAQISSAVLAVLSAPGMSQMSLMLGGNGAGLMKPEDGIQSTAFDASLPGPFVKARLADATSPQSLEELDNVAR